LSAGLDQLGVKLDRLGTDLRGEIRSSAADTRAYVDERIQTSTVEMRRFFGVVGESLRGEIRSVAELVALSNEQREKAGQKPRRPRHR